MISRWIFFVGFVLACPWCQSLCLSNPKWINYRKLSYGFGVVSNLLLLQSPQIHLASTPVTYRSSATIATDYISRGKTKLPPESNIVFMEAKRAEAGGNFEKAKTLFFEVIEAEPDYIYTYASLGNIYASEGKVNKALVYLNKAIKLLPPADVLISLLITKGTLESNLQSFPTALQDLELAEKLFDSQYNQLKIRMSSKWENVNYKNIQINKAVIYSRTNQWSKAYELFDQILYNSAERNLSPWNIRYVLSGLEVLGEKEPMRKVPKVSDDYLQRLLLRFPKEPECNALATSISMLQDDEPSARNYWHLLSEEDQKIYSSESFLENTVNWGPRAREGLQLFLKRL